MPPRLSRPESPESRFLRGPQSRQAELRRAIGIFAEFLRGFRKYHFVGPCVTVFGSARFDEEHRYYKLARETGRRLAQAGFTVMTGGGPGIMEAANRGAKDVGGRSIGCNIELPFEQSINPYLDVSMTFEHFYVRKVMLLKYSYAFIALPGGFGTFDEVFETAMLIQTQKIRDFPIVCIGSEFWEPLLEPAITSRIWVWPPAEAVALAPVPSWLLRVPSSFTISQLLPQSQLFGDSWAAPRHLTMLVVSPTPEARAISTNSPSHRF